MNKPTLPPTAAETNHTTALRIFNAIFSKPASSLESTRSGLGFLIRSADGSETHDFCFPAFNPGGMHIAAGRRIAELLKGTAK